MKNKDKIVGSIVLLGIIAIFLVFGYVNTRPQNISKDDLEKILYDVVRNYDIELINKKGNNTQEILDEYKQDMETLDYASGTIRNRMYTLKYFLDYVNKEIPQITVVDLKAYLNFKKKSVKTSTVNGLISVIKSFFSWLVEEEYIDKNPTKKLRKIKEPQRIREPLSIEEMENLRMCCKTIFRQQKR